MSSSFKNVWNAEVSALVTYWESTYPDLQTPSKNSWYARRTLLGGSALCVLGTRTLDTSHVGQFSELAGIVIDTMYDGGNEQTFKLYLRTSETANRLTVAEKSFEDLSTKEGAIRTEAGVTLFADRLRKVVDWFFCDSFPDGHPFR